MKLTICLLLLGVVSGSSYLARAARVEATEKKQSPQPQSARKKPASVLYVENCARCHGADGRGETPMGEMYDVTNLADAAWWKKERVNDKRLASAIRDGRGGMPAFGKKLSKSEIGALVGYVKKFNGK